jgi:PncC family amidohydrolase
MTVPKNIGTASDAERLAQALLTRGETLAVVETSAGGSIAAALTSIAGSSRWLAGSAVAYGDVARQQWLGITAAELPDGVVSEAAARLMAERVRDRLGTTWGLAETGIAGPQTGRRSRKPVGLVYIALAGTSGTAVHSVTTGHSERAPNQAAFAHVALAFALAHI